MSLHRFLVVALALSSIACGSSPRKFPLRDPMWVDNDQKPFQGKPEEYWSPLAWDAADQTIFRPVSKFLAVRPGGEATNVNAFDEVPSSSWFERRAGTMPLSRDDFRDGACKGRPPLSTNEKWIVTSAKPNGANPGFMIKAADGRKYLMKFEVDQVERASSADAIGSRIYYAAGFYTPCNSVVFMKPEILEIDPNATAEEDNEKVKLTRAHLDSIFKVAAKTPEGTYRASASLLLEGKPLGPWKYDGIRDDDPNDVVAHEDRRELRASHLLAAWTHHFDAREQNTLAMWMTNGDKDQGYVRHAFLDWGDCFGSIWDWDRLNRRFGHSYYLYVGQVLGDFVTLGLYPRPWDRVKEGPAGRVLSYYDVDTFDPENWLPGYPNPAFGRMTERDAAWMARIIAKIDEDAIDAMVDAAQIKNAVVDKELRRVLKGRRDKLLRRWLKKLSPLTSPEIVGDKVCLEDVVVTAKLAPMASRKYLIRGYAGEKLEQVEMPTATSPSDGRVCVALPGAAGASTTSPRYTIVDVHSWSPGFEAIGPARVHLYDLGGSYKVVGLERPSSSDRP
jgi:hypothetical protein